MKKFNFKPFDKVLVRDNKNEWTADIFSHYNKDGRPKATSNCSWGEAIPFEGNEHLLGTTDDYVEPYVPKDGDFVYCKGDNKHIIIFKDIEYDIIHTYIELLENNTLRNPFVTNKSIMKDFRPATDSEKQQLLDALHKDGKDWDAEKKEIVEYRWMPSMNKLYYYAGSEGIVETAIFKNTNFDRARVNIGNCFQTEEEAKPYSDKFKDLLKGGKK